LRTFTDYLIEQQVIAFKKVIVLEATSSAVNAILHMTCIITHNKALWE